LGAVEYGYADEREAADGGRADCGDRPNDMPGDGKFRAGPLNFLLADGWLATCDMGAIDGCGGASK